MSGHFADRLVRVISQKGSPACVGLDPVDERLPVDVRKGDAVGSLESFCAHVLDAVCECVPAVKVQSACFERYGGEGVGAMQRVCARARERGLIVVLDAKRGDIGISAEHYASFAFEACGADALTISIAMGLDTAQAYLRPDRGVFALVRTSNPGSDRVQSERLESGGTVAEHFGSLVRELGSEFVGDGGYSSVGAVVAATKPGDASRMREVMPEQYFLVPGFGAQGGTIETVRELFDASGRGALVTASRSVIYAEATGTETWIDAVRGAAARFANELHSVTA
ncbi:MAG: orotidine-5'-phosphate decarboxylase [Planctomycetota bacterium]|jgi:orotidine-5'-phosphate decarboxylase